MEKQKDIYIKIKGNKKDVEHIVIGIEEELNKFELKPESKEIKATPIKIEKEKIKKTKTQDIMVTFTGRESKVEKVMEEVNESIYSKLKLESNSKSIGYAKKGEEKCKVETINTEKPLL